MGQLEAIVLDAAHAGFLHQEEDASLK